MIDQVMVTLVESGSFNQPRQTLVIQAICSAVLLNNGGKGALAVMES